MRIDPGIKAVLFDFDDTLVSTMPPKWAAHRHVARVFYGRQLSDTELARHWGKPLPRLCQLLYGDHDSDRALGRLALSHQQFPKIRFDCTIPILAAARVSGHKLGLVTSSTRWHLDYDLAALSIPESVFDYTQTCDDTEHHKPNPRVFDQAVDWLSAIGIESAQAVYIGDSLCDWRAATGAGLSFIGVGTGLVSVTEWRGLGQQCVASLDSLIFEPPCSVIV